MLLQLTIMQLHRNKDERHRQQHDDRDQFHRKRSGTEHDQYLWRCRIRHEVKRSDGELDGRRDSVGCTDGRNDSVGASVRWALPGSERVGAQALANELPSWSSGLACCRPVGEVDEVGHARRRRRAWGTCGETEGAVGGRDGRIAFRLMESWLLNWRLGRVGGNGWFWRGFTAVIQVVGISGCVGLSGVGLCCIGYCWAIDRGSGSSGFG